MRVVLIGRTDERARLRALVADTGVIVAGEAATMADAERAGLGADAFLIVSASGTSRVGPATRLMRSGAAIGSGADLVETIEEPLTPREHDVLELLAEGLSNKAIAARLGISDQTVKFHVAAICGKLGVANRTEAVRKALRRGLITL